MEYTQTCTYTCGYIPTWLYKTKVCVAPVLKLHIHVNMPTKPAGCSATLIRQLNKALEVLKAVALKEEEAQPQWANILA